jgi:hypothetical protein
VLTNRVLSSVNLTSTIGVHQWPNIVQYVSPYFQASHTQSVMGISQGSAYPVLSDYSWSDLSGAVCDPKYAGVTGSKPFLGKKIYLHFS